MELPSEPVVLTPSQVEELNHALTETRHTINNYLSLITAAAEILTRKPETASRMLPTLVSQPLKVSDEIRKFSEFFEQMLQIKKDSQR